MAKGKPILSNIDPLNTGFILDPANPVPPKTIKYPIQKDKLIVRFKTPAAFEKYKNQISNSGVIVNQLYFFEKGTKYDLLSESEKKLYNTAFLETSPNKPINMENEYKKLNLSDDVAYAMFDQAYRLFAETPTQDSEEANWWFKAINAVNALGAYQQHPQNIAKVAVIDSGIDHKYIRSQNLNQGHPDLDVNSFIKHENRRDFKKLTWDEYGNLTCSGNGLAIPIDQQSYDDVHGTHVAGIIGALDNKYYTVGIAHQSRLMNLWAFPGATERTLAVAIKYAANNVIEEEKDKENSKKYYVLRVINASWGSRINLNENPNVGKALKDAIDYACTKGIVFVCAAGNEDGPVENFVPSGFDNVIAVGSVYPSPKNAQIVRAPSSNYGKNVIGAPGVNIESLDASVDDKILPLSGTSMAAAFVSGLVARMLEIRPDLVKVNVQEPTCNHAIRVLEAIKVIDQGIFYADGDTKIIGRGLIDVDGTLGSL